MGPIYTAAELKPIPGLSIRAMNDSRLTERIRLIDEACLAVKYSDDYYATYVSNGLHIYNQLAFYHDILIGSITCRLETTSVDNEYILYIMTVCVLKPYRRMGIGYRLVETILNNVHHETNMRIRSVRLHVQVGSSVLHFYSKFHFDVAEEVKDYYCDLDQCDALLLTRDVPQPYLDRKKSK